MTLIDIIILIILVIVVGLVVYFSFIKNKNNKCAGCPYAKGCNNMSCKKGN